ncbi:Ribosomal RNA-processing protein-like protein [Gracilaria domingensis]|nr:Ribosomal RNA-processing protein-like protein [Gracilaria domingensis]
MHFACAMPASDNHWLPSVSAESQRVPSSAKAIKRFATAHRTRFRSEIFFDGLCFMVYACLRRRHIEPCAYRKQVCKDLALYKIDMVSSKQRSKKLQNHVQVRRLCGYVALNLEESSVEATLGWLYLRKHSPTELFVGNLPMPAWFPYVSSSSEIVPPEPQRKFKAILNKLFPTADCIGDIFSTSNGRLATRITMKGGEKDVEQVLASPKDYLYMEYWRELHAPGAQPTFARYLEAYKDARDTEKVLEWSNAAMKAFELREQRRKEEKERLDKNGEPDEDGFVTVTSGAKQMKAAEAQALTATKNRFKNRGTKRSRSLLDSRKGIEKDGFYRWQRRRDNVVSDLQKKFRDDRKRIAAIRGLKSE